MAGQRDVLETVREEDFIEYFVFPSILDNDTADKSETLKSVLSEIQSVFKKYGSNYIWQKDEINLIPRSSSDLLAVENNAGRFMCYH